MRNQCTNIHDSTMKLFDILLDVCLDTPMKLKNIKCKPMTHSFQATSIVQSKPPAFQLFEKYLQHQQHSRNRCCTRIFCMFENRRKYEWNEIVAGKLQRRTKMLYVYCLELIKGKKVVSSMYLSESDTIRDVADIPQTF